MRKPDTNLTKSAENLKFRILVDDVFIYENIVRKRLI